jgi:hypothetical protein
MIVTRKARVFGFGKSSDSVWLIEDRLFIILGDE